MPLEHPGLGPRRLSRLSRARSTVVVLNVRRRLGLTQSTPAGHSRDPLPACFRTSDRRPGPTLRS